MTKFKVGDKILIEVEIESLHYYEDGVNLDYLTLKRGDLNIDFREPDWENYHGRTSHVVLKADSKDIKGVVKDD